MRPCCGRGFLDFTTLTNKTSFTSSKDLLVYTHLYIYIYIYINVYIEIYSAIDISYYITTYHIIDSLSLYIYTIFYRINCLAINCRRKGRARAAVKRRNLFNCREPRARAQGARKEFFPSRKGFCNGTCAQGFTKNLLM